MTTFLSFHSLVLSTVTSIKAIITTFCSRKKLPWTHNTSAILFSYTTSLFICIKYINSGEVFLQAIAANLCQSSKQSFELNNLWLLCLIMLLPQSFKLTIHIFFLFLLVLKWALMSLGAFIVSLKHNSSGKLCNPVISTLSENVSYFDAVIYSHI